MFLLSLSLIIISSYLILSVLSSKTKNIYPFLYLLLIAFSQVTVSVEILSVLKAITRNNFIICNIVFFIFSFIFFIKKGNGLYKPEYKEKIRKIVNALKRDKLLLLCCCFLGTLTIIQQVIILNYPYYFADAYNYYFPRAVDWIQNMSLAHYTTGDSRELIMPVNVDILYMLHFLFFKTDRGCEYYSFLGYISSLNILYLFIKELGFSTRRALWSICAFASFALVVVFSIIACSELICGALVLLTIFLFYIAIKKEDKYSLFMSSLSAALSVGVKTTALIAIPSVLFILAVILFLYKPQNIKKIISFYFIFFIVNFIVFSSYNYILNFIEFSNPLSSRELFLLNKFRGGIHGYICNLLKYVFLMFDMSGIFWDFPSKLLNIVQNKVFNLAGYSLTDYGSPYFKGYIEYNRFVGIFDCVLGVSGVLIFIPSLIKALKLRFKSKREFILSAFAIAFILNILIMSRVMIFTEYNGKYLMTFFVISAPVILYSYIRKTSFFKIVLCALFFWFLILIPSLKFYDTSKLQNDEEVKVAGELAKLPPGRIALNISQIGTMYFPIEKLYFKGFKINKILTENIYSYNLNDYDYIITAMYQTEDDSLQKKEFVEYNKACIYTDYNKKEITDKNTKRIASVLCPTPHEYFAKSGYTFLFETDKYIVLKNGRK